MKSFDSQYTYTLNDRVDMDTHNNIFSIVTFIVIDRNLVPWSWTPEANLGEWSCKHIHTSSLQTVAIFPSVTIGCSTQEPKIWGLAALRVYAGICLSSFRRGKYCSLNKNQHKEYTRISGCYLEPFFCIRKNIRQWHIVADYIQKFEFWSFTNFRTCFHSLNRTLWE